MVDGVAGMVPYIHAARGLIAFRTGELEAGQRAYSEAVLAGGKLEGSGLGMIAMIYWIEQEATVGLLNIEDLTEFDRLIESKISASGSVGRRSRKLWAVRKKVITEFLTKTVRQPACHLGRLETRTFALSR